MKKIKYILIFLAILIPSSIFALSITTECFEVGAWDGYGHPICGIACTDGTLYLMDCNADIFQ
jgi:hypothetical protein